MTNDQATLDKLDRMRLHGMARALRTSLEILASAPPPSCCGWPTAAGSSTTRTDHHRQVRLREELPGFRAGPSGVSARVPGRLPCVIAAVRATAPGQG